MATTRFSFLQRLKEKWGLTSLWQVILILVVFSLAGSTAVFAKGLLFDALGYSATTPAWLKTITYLAFLFPMYQCLLLAYGFLFGQFSFFWEKEKKMAAAIKRGFQKIALRLA